MKILFVTLLTTGLFIHGTALEAQNSINTSGGNATGSGGTICFAVGQLTYCYYSSASGSITQGVQQPYEISVITYIEQARDIKLICSVYPNPASEFLILKFEDYTHGSLSYKLFDANGILLKSNRLKSNETTIPMANLCPAIYFIKITDNDKVIKTFKIIKN